jgi:hypothetical protein
MSILALRSNQGNSGMSSRHSRGRLASYGKDGAPRTSCLDKGQMIPTILEKESMAVFSRFTILSFLFWDIFTLAFSLAPSNICTLSNLLRLMPGVA